MLFCVSLLGNVTVIGLGILFKVSHIILILFWLFNFTVSGWKQNNMLLV